MLCPECKKEFTRPKNVIYKHGNQNFLKSSCPFCSYVLKEEKISVGKHARLFGIIVLVPFVFIALLLLSFAVKNSFTVNYLELTTLTISSIFLLLFISEIRKKIKK